MVILPFFLLLLLPLATAQTARFCGNGDSGNFTSNRAYQANLRLLSSTLPKKAAANTTLFATHTIGDAPDTIFALTLCRGDINASVCEGCVATAFEDGPRLCPYNKDVTLFYDACLLRFSNKNFLTTTDNSAVILMNTQNFTTSVDSTRLLLFTLINNTAQVATGSIRRFATSRLDVIAFTTMYCLMQCRPDLTTDDCTVCFEVVLQDTLGYIDYKQGTQGLGTRCTMRYEIYPFFFGDPMLRIMNLATEVPAINNTAPGSMPPAGTPTQNPVVQTSVRTSRGYMSPEYASEGIYSINSDVFSFGVLLLEILSGKRNSGFHQYGDFLNLLGYSWQLWEGGIWIELLESSIAKEIHITEAKRHINIALMCLQESADDRPTMSEVVAMLSSESVILPEPNHPAYFNLRVSKVHESASVVVPCSNNDVTITAEPDGR
ncbi:hypothetical protein ACQ4PT_005274 [Festuca glaucescens]